MSLYKEILYEITGSVAVLTMNRPETLNALTDLTQAEIRHALGESDENPEVVGTVLENALLEVHLNSLDGFPQDDSASNRLAFAMLVCTASELVVGAEINFVRIMLRRNGELEAINAPVSDGDPPEEGAPVACTNYASFIEPDGDDDKTDTPTVEGN